ncbi:hypothetical protein C8R46DRAFT_1342260 [Mycena filopes]|nr:hypothetical protein C8R46DRAFT_1342260 [Mycena filopes]
MNGSILRPPLAPASMPRPLSLHSSALNNTEYTLFKADLASLTDEYSDNPEAQQLSILETRGWIRGRYPAIPAPIIAQILALFPSNDTIDGGEFFAALRLVLHVEAGRDVNRALVFVQVHPQYATIVSTPPVLARAEHQRATDAAAGRIVQHYNPSVDLQRAFCDAYTAVRDTALAPMHPSASLRPSASSSSSSRPRASPEHDLDRDRKKPSIDDRSGPHCDGGICSQLRAQSLRDTGFVGLRETFRVTAMSARRCCTGQLLVATGFLRS